MPGQGRQGKQDASLGNFELSLEVTKDVKEGVGKEKLLESLWGGAGGWDSASPWSLQTNSSCPGLCRLQHL